MEELIIEDIDEALSVVSGERLHDYMFEGLHDSAHFNEDTLKMMTSDLAQNCENNLEILAPEKLNVLYNTFANKTEEKDYYKEAFNRVTDAIDRVIAKFNDDQIQINGGDIAYLNALIEKRTKDAEKTGADKTIYDSSKIKLDEFTKEYDEKYNLTDFNEDTVDLMYKNFEKMDLYYQDGIIPDKSHDNKIVKVPPEKMKDFLAQRINDKNDVSYSDLASALLSAKHNRMDEVYNNLLSKTKEKIKENKPINGKDLAGAKVIEQILSNEAKNIKKFNSYKQTLQNQIKNSEKFAQDNHDIRDVEKLVDKIEIVRDRGLFWNRKIPQKDENGKLKKDSELGLWLQTIKERTKCQLLGCKNLNKDEFNSTYATNVHTEYLKLLKAQKISIGKDVDVNNPKDVKKAVKDIDNALTGKKKHRINQHILINNVSKLINDNESFKSRLSHKIERTIDSMESGKNRITKVITANNLLGKISDNIKKIDTKCEEKFGRVYVLGKALSKPVMWVGAATLAGNLAQGAVLATTLVNGSRFAIAAYKFSKSYFDEKKKHREASGPLKQRTYRFRDHIKKNHDQVVGLACLGCGVVGSALGGSAGAEVVKGVFTKAGISACYGSALFKILKNANRAYEQSTGENLDINRRNMMGMKENKVSLKDKIKNVPKKIFSKAFMKSLLTNVAYASSAYLFTRMTSSALSGNAVFSHDMGLDDTVSQNMDINNTDASHGDGTETDGKDILSKGKPSGKDIRSKGKASGKGRIKTVRINNNPLRETNVSNSAGNEKINVAQTIMNASKSR